MPQAQHVVVTIAVLLLNADVPAESFHYSSHTPKSSNEPEPVFKKRYNFKFNIENGATSYNQMG